MSLVERTGSANPFSQIDVGDASKPTFADIDGDGDRDLIVGNEQGGFNYYRNDGNGRYTQLTGVDVNPVHSLYGTGNYTSVAFADLDRDGDLDAIVGASNGNLDYFRNSGTVNGVLQWQRTETGSPFRNYNQNTPRPDFSTVSFADLDRDGDLDAFVGSGDAGIIFLRNDGGTFNRADGTANPFNQWNLENFSNNRVVTLTNPSFGDFDGDGDLDAAIGSGFGPIAYLENVNGVFTERTGVANPFRAWNDQSNQSPNNDLSAPAFTDIDGDGDLDVVVGVVDGRLRYLENTGGGNQPQPPGDTIIEAAGNADLLNTATGYRLRPDNGTAVSLRLQGTPVTSTSIPGWQAVGTEARAGGGYEVMWRDTTGQHILWLVDGSGNYTSHSGLSAAELIGKEAFFQQDFNGDGNTGAVVTATIEAAGNADLLNTNIGYQLRPDGGTAVSLRLQGNLMTSSSLPGWQAVGTESRAGGGYEVMWRNTNGQHAVWTVDANGNYVTGSMLTAAGVIGKETFFQQDFNGDGRLGIVVTETLDVSGNADFVNTTIGYQIRPDGGDALSLRFQCTNVTSTTVAGWQALGAEARVGGGYEVMWKHTNGQYALWTVDGNGNYLSSNVISAAEVIAKEAFFLQDFNGDGNTGPTVTATIEAVGNADLLNTNVGYQLRPDGGTAVSLRLQGNLVNSASLPGWQPVGTEARAGGGYEVMWQHTNGQHAVWTVDANGNYVTGSVLTAAEVIGKEAFFQQDFNGDRAIGPVVINPIEAVGNADLLNTNVGYQLRPDGGTAVSLRLQGNLVNSASLPGWQPVGTEARAGGGYEVMWRDTTGQHILWLVDGSGNYTSHSGLSATELIGKEAFFQQDFNGDGRLGNGAQNPPAGTVVEAAGNARLLSSAAGYQVQPEGGAALLLTVNGSNFTDAAVPAWQPLGIERLESGAYEMVLKSRTTADRYHLWEFDANGVHGNFRTISGAELLSKEALFQQDFNGDTRIGTATLNTLSTGAQNWSEFSLTADAGVLNQGITSAGDLEIATPVNGSSGRLATQLLSPQESDRLYNQNVAATGFGAGGRLASLTATPTFNTSNYPLQG